MLREPVVQPARVHPDIQFLYPPTVKITADPYSHLDTEAPPHVRCRLRPPLRALQAPDKVGGKPHMPRAGIWGQKTIAETNPSRLNRACMHEAAVLDLGVDCPTPTGQKRGCPKK